MVQDNVDHGESPRTPSARESAPVRGRLTDWATRRLAPLYSQARPDPSALDAFCDFLSKQLLDFKVDSAACFASSAPTTARDATLPHAPQPRSREGNRIAAMINVVKTLIVGLNPRASARDGRWWFRAGNALVEGLLVSPFFVCHRCIIFLGNLLNGHYRLSHRSISRRTTSARERRKISLVRSRFCSWLALVS
jgi:hypothetical protein